MSFTQSGDVPPEAKVGWKEETSASGAKYQVKASDYDISEASGASANEVNASGPSFTDYKVDWQFGHEGATSEECQDRTAISWYKLGSAPWYSWYKYELTINTKDTYNYTFYDETDDYYGLNAFVIGGTHWVQYRSNKPNIVRVSGK